MLPVERVIGDGGLTADGDTVRLEIRLPWYRSLPLSTVAIEALTIDGREYGLAELNFELEGRRWPLPALSDLTAESWFVLDPAWLVAPGPAPAPGSTHEVSVTLSLFPPYIPGMKRVNTETQTLRVG